MVIVRKHEDIPWLCYFTGGLLPPNQSKKKHNPPPHTHTHTHRSSPHVSIAPLVFLFGPSGPKLYRPRFSTKTTQKWWRFPICSMYGTYTYIWLKFTVNVPGPSKVCQMVPKGCQFTIPSGLIGTLWKVLVGVYIYIYIHINFKHI